MACEDWSSYRDALLEGAFFDVTMCPFTDVLGETGFAVIFFAPIVISLYFTTRSIAVPAVVLVISGGVIMTMLPAAFANAAMVLFVTGLAAGAWLVTMRMRRE